MVRKIILLGVFFLLLQPAYSNPSNKELSALLNKLKKELQPFNKPDYKSVLYELGEDLIESTPFYMKKHFRSLCPTLMKIYPKLPNVETQLHVLGIISSLGNEKKCANLPFLHYISRRTPTLDLFISQIIMEMLVRREVPSLKVSLYVKTHIKTYLHQKEYSTERMLRDTQILVQMKHRERKIEQLIKQKTLSKIKRQEDVKDALKILGILYEREPHITHLLFSYLKEKKHPLSHTAIKVLASYMFSKLPQDKQKELAVHLKKRIDYLYTIFMKPNQKAPSYSRTRAAELAVLSMNMGKQFLKSSQLLHRLISDTPLHGPGSLIDKLSLVSKKSYLRIMKNKSSYQNFLQMMNVMLGCQDGVFCRVPSNPNHPFYKQKEAFEICMKNRSFAYPLLPLLRVLLKKNKVNRPKFLNRIALWELIHTLEAHKKTE